MVTQLDRGGARTITEPLTALQVSTPVPIYSPDAEALRANRWPVVPTRKWNQILCLRLVPFLKNPQDRCPGHLNGEEVTGSLLRNSMEHPELQRAGLRARLTANAIGVTQRL